MEKVALNNIQLDHLAGTNPNLSRVFYGTLPAEGPSAFIVNIDPHDEPGTHWIAHWTRGNVCEILDSYALPLKTYVTAESLQEWLDRHFKYLVSNGMGLQSLFSQSCGGYALMYLIDRAEGRSMDYFWTDSRKKIM